MKYPLEHSSFEAAKKLNRTTNMRNLVNKNTTERKVNELTNKPKLPQAK